MEAVIKLFKETVTFADLLTISIAVLSCLGSFIGAGIAWWNKRKAKASEELAQCYAKNADKANIAIMEYYNRHRLPNIIVDFIVVADIRFAIRNDGNSAAQDIKVEINYLDEWIHSYSERGGSFKIYSLSCEQLKESIFNLMPHKEKYFVIGCLDETLLKKDVEVKIKYKCNGEVQPEITALHNLQLYNFVNGDIKDPIVRLADEIDGLSQVIKSRDTFNGGNP